MNNAFAYDLVPSPSVIIAALRAARRVNDYPTAVRIFEGTRTLGKKQKKQKKKRTAKGGGRRRRTTLTSLIGIKAKVENKGQYDEYIQELNGIREELGINLKETMYPELA